MVRRGRRHRGARDLDRRVGGLCAARSTERHNHSGGPLRIRGPTLHQLLGQRSGHQVWVAAGLGQPVPADRRLRRIPRSECPHIELHNGSAGAGSGHLGGECGLRIRDDSRGVLLADDRPVERGHGVLDDRLSRLVIHCDTRACSLCSARCNARVASPVSCSRYRSAPRIMRGSALQPEPCKAPRRHRAQGAQASGNSSGSRAGQESLDSCAEGPRERQFGPVEMPRAHKVSPWLRPVTTP